MLLKKKKQHNEEIAIKLSQKVEFTIELSQKVEFTWMTSGELINDFVDVNGYVK